MVVFGLVMVNQGWQQLVWVVLGIMVVVQGYLELKGSK